MLEESATPLAVVTAIAGQSRLRARFGGRAGHAGTQPMVLRRDGLAAASEWILEVEALAMDTDDLVATVGTIEVEGAASNVVPGGVVCALDVRHPDDNAREAAVGELMSSARRISAKRGVGFDEVFHDRQSAVPMDSERCKQQLGAAAQRLGIAAPSMVSGAGHDAAFIAEICPASVLFLRTPGGESHNPAEAVDVADVALGLRVMREFLEEKMRNYQSLTLRGQSAMFLLCSHSERRERTNEVEEFMLISPCARLQKPLRHGFFDFVRASLRSE